MIVRISNEGQYRLDDGHHARLDGLDNAVVQAVESEDEDGFHAAFEQLLHFVRSEGEPLDADDLEPSEFILPPADLALSEAGEEFSGQRADPDPAPPARRSRPPERRRAVPGAAAAQRRVAAAPAAASAPATAAPAPAATTPRCSASQTCALRALDSSANGPWAPWSPRTGEKR